jgi:hypothetical protein
MKRKAEWTFMVYLAGDNNLSDAGDEDLREMRTVGSTADVNVVAQFDNAGNRGTARYHIQRKKEKETVVSLGETDSGDPKTLIEFAKWAAKDYPAERYALILWNHGGGWEPLEIDGIARDAGARGYSVREVGELAGSPLKKLLFRSSIKTILGRSSAEERAICCDDGSGHSLDTVELGNALAQIKDALGKPIDLLGMDACLMSNLEVAHEAQSFVKYIVASEESEPNNGWPYDAVLSKLVETPAVSTPDLASHIVDAYIKFYRDTGYAGAVTQAALDLSRVDSLTEPLDTLAGALKTNMSEVSREIFNAHRKSPRFWHNTLCDLALFSEELGKLIRLTDVREAAKQVCSALQPGPGRFVCAEAHRGAKVERCGGVTIYLLQPLAEISQYYADLKYGKEHGWLSMLQAYHAAVF